MLEITVSIPLAAWNRAFHIFTPNNDAAPAVDLLVGSPSAVGYISGAQAISGGLPATTLYRVATAEYDLRPLGDDPASDGEGDELLVDVLEEAISCQLSAIS